MPPVRRNLPYLVALAIFFFGLYHLSTHQASEGALGVVSKENSAGVLGLKKPYADDTSTSLETTIPGKELVHGFTLLDRLYLRDGTFYIIASNVSEFPPRRNMISPLMDIDAGHELEPTDKVRVQPVTPGDFA